MRNNKYGGLALLVGIWATFLTLGCDGCDDPDKVVFLNENGNEIGLLVDAADSAGEFIDRKFMTTGTEMEFAYDLLERADEQEEVVAFTQGRQPFARNPCFFHDGYDLVSIDFQDEIAIDFAIWIVDATLLNPVSNRENETLDQLAYLEERWEEERLGLVVGDVVFHDRTGDADAEDLRDCDDCDDAYFADLAADIGHTDGAINVYLIRKAGDQSWAKYYGQAGDIGDSDQIIMGMCTGSEDLLMHEVGHLQTLEHVDDEDDFDNKNVMPHSSGLSKRQYFTEGQVFRATFDTHSVINGILQLRTGMYMMDACSHSHTATVSCPAVQKRLWSDGALGPN